jgi:hypothetical protein
MIVLNNTAITGACTLTGAAGQPFLSHGQLYALGGSGYLLTPLIQSRVTTATGGSGTTTMVDPIQKTISLRGADVSLTVEAVSVLNPDGSFTVSTPATKQVDPFSVLFSGSLPPNGTVNVGFEVIPPATAQRILSIAGYQAGQRMSAEVLAQVTIRGDLGGDEVTATPFYFPISVCTDCVVNVVGPCPAAGTQTGNACNVFQDGVVDCCTSGNQLVCPTQAM